MRRVLARGVGALMLVVTPAASAQTTPGVDLIQARQAHFREIGSAFKAVNDELKKDAPGKYILTSSASRIASALRETGAMFPVGTGPAPGVKTKARSEIWSDKAEFDRATAAVATEAQKLAMLSRSGDLGATRAQVKVLGAGCQSCHRQFRAN